MMAETIRTGPYLRIILIAAKKDYVLEAPLGEAPIPEKQDVMNAWQSRADDYSLVQCGMLYSLEPGLQKRFEQHGAYEIFEELKLVFQAHARVERYDVSDKFYSCKMEEYSSVSEHILKMSGFSGTGASPSGPSRTYWFLAAIRMILRFRTQSV